MSGTPLPHSLVLSYISTTLTAMFAVLGVSVVDETIDSAAHALLDAYIAPTEVLDFVARERQARQERPTAPHDAG